MYTVRVNKWVKRGEQMYQNRGTNVHPSNSIVIDSNRISNADARGDGSDEPLVAAAPAAARATDAKNIKLKNMFPKQ